MGKKSSPQYDQSRDKRYSAYVYVGDLKFRKSNCIKRGPKTGKCYEWKQEFLDLKVIKDEEFIRSSMILMGESEL